MISFFPCLRNIPLFSGSDISGKCFFDKFQQDLRAPDPRVAHAKIAVSLIIFSKLLKHEKCALK